MVASDGGADGTVRERTERSRNAFARYMPQVLLYLDSLGESAARPVIEDGAVVNLDLMGKSSLYSRDARDWTRRQVEAYLEDPDRIGFDSVDHCNLSPVSLALFQDIADYFSRQRLSEFENFPKVDVGFAFVFGVGLGYHVAPLVENNLCRHLILVEPVAEFLLHSMAAVEWAEIFAAAEDKGIKLHFLLDPRPEVNVRNISEIIRKFGSTFLDGSYAYVHYSSWANSEGRALLNEKIRNHFVSSGFFEDELVMMANSYQNLRRWAAHVVSRQPYLSQSCPVFIVGNGPSLDRDIENIRKWREHVVLISCGTGLAPLLAHGLRPDLHVENENVPLVADLLTRMHDMYGLEGITLVATATVDPAVAGLFEKRWFYFRYSVSAGALMTGPAKALYWADPLVPNAAFAVAVTLGFKEIYLLGVDCGRRVGAGHHSMHSLYYQDDIPGLVAADLEERFGRRVPGNFGGEVETSWSLDLSRESLSALQREARVDLYNCSDGARIDEAKPKVAASIRLSGRPGDGQRALQRVERQLRYCQAAEFLEQIDIGGFRYGCELFLSRFAEVIDRSRQEDEGFWALDQRLERLWDASYAECKGVLAIIGGSYANMVRLGAYAGTRIADAGARREFFHHFLDRYQQLCNFMTEETERLYGQMEARVEELQPCRSVWEARAQSQLEKDPQSVDARVALATVAHNRRDYGLTRKWASEAVALAPAHPMAVLRYAQGLSKCGDLEAGLAQYRRLIELAPEMVDGYLGTGRVLLELGYPAEALEYLEKGLALDPSWERAAAPLMKRARSEIEQWGRA